MAYKKSNPNGQATMANSEPVVIASNQTDVPVALGATDNAVLDAIAASVAAIDTDTSTIIGHVDGIEALIGTTNTTLTAIDGHVDGLETSNSAIQTAVELIDNAAVVLGTATYTEATSTGLAVGAVRRDADTTLVNTTNEWGPLQMDANGRLKVEVFSGETLPVSGTVTADLGATDNAVLDAIAASVAAIDTDTTTLIGHVDGLETSNSAIQTAVELIDDTVATLGTTTYTEATSKGLVVGAVRRDADTPLANTTNEMSPLITDANGYLKVEIFDGGGSHTVDNNGTFVTQVDGAALTALQLIDDIVYTDDTSTHSTGSSKGALIMAAAVPTDTSVNANDIAAVAMTTDRKLHVAVMDALPAGSAAIGKLAANSGVDIGDVTLTANSGVDIGDVDVLSVVPGTGKTNLGKAEDGGHTSGDVGVFNLGVRVDTPNAALTNTDADYSPITTNKLGSLRVAYPEDDLATAATKHVKKYYTNAGAVTDGIVWSPASGARWFVTDLIINVSAAATVTLEDDLVAGDSAVMKFELAANSGIAHSFATPLFSGEDAADLLITTSAGNVYVTVTGYEI